MPACMHTSGGWLPGGTISRALPTPSSSCLKAACHGKAIRYVNGQKGLAKVVNQSVTGLQPVHLEI